MRTLLESTEKTPHSSSHKQVYSPKAWRIFNLKMVPKSASPGLGVSTVQSQLFSPMLHKHFPILLPVFYSNVHIYLFIYSNIYMECQFIFFLTSKSFLSPLSLTINPPLHSKCSHQDHQWVAGIGSHFCPYLPGALCSLWHCCKRPFWNYFLSPWHFLLTLLLLCLSVY